MVISNPISTSAVFIVLTKDFNHAERIKTAKKSIKHSTVIFLFFSITGLLLFQIFGFGIGAFRIAGGVLLFTLSISMINPPTSQTHAKVVGGDITLIPLTIPLTVGPGTIVSTVLLMSEAQNIAMNEDFGTGALAIAGVYMGIIVVLVITYLVMIRSEYIERVLKEGGSLVLTKFFGLIVMAISIQYIINGIKDVVPEFLAMIG